MSTEFDPYHRWLGIPAKHQPADCYRLLALERFEDDPEVIVDAAERQIAHVRRYALGPHQDISQRILNELAAAKVCLLNPDKKAEYDRQLREQVAAQEQAVPPVEPPAPAARLIVAALARPELHPSDKKAEPPKTRVRRLSADRHAWPAVLTGRVLALAGGCGLLVLVIAVVFVLPRSASDSETNSRRVTEPRPPVEPVEPNVPSIRESPKPPAKQAPATFVENFVQEFVEEFVEEFAEDERPKSPEKQSPPVPVGFATTSGATPANDVATRHEPALDSLVSVEDSSPAISAFDAAEAKEHQRMCAESLGVEVEFTNSIGMTFKLIPAEEFLMGSPDGDSAASSDEKPQHLVRITKPFYLGVTEVTQEQYERVVGTNPSQFKGDRQRPVEMVSWADAVAFCGKLSAQQGQTYRLPTEAEWEHACRAGSKTKWSFGGDVSALKDYAWYSENAGGTTHTVAQKKPNAWGLYDMHGNVSEWCHDWFGDRYYATSPTNDPTGASGGSHRVTRGGCWGGAASRNQASFRDWRFPGSRHERRGFRLARTVSFPSP